MAVHSVRLELEQDIEDCMSQLQSLASGKLHVADVEVCVASLKRRLTELCAASGGCSSKAQHQTLEWWTLGIGRSSGKRSSAKPQRPGSLMAAERPANRSQNLTSQCLCDNGSP